MSNAVYGFDTNKLTAIVELLDEARTAIKELRADPIQLVVSNPATSVADSITPVIYHGGDMLQLEITSNADADDSSVYSVEELMMHCINNAEADEFDQIIALLIRLLSAAHTQRAQMA